MPLDPDKLCSDVEAHRADRGKAIGSGGRPRSGAMSIVRQHLAAITALRDDGATWSEIAAALAKQGIVQGNGTPMTGRHLTALIASIRRQDTERAAAQARRAALADLRHVSTMTSPVVMAREQKATIHKEPVQGSPNALFHRLDRNARQEAEIAAERPDFSRGLAR